MKDLGELLGKEMERLDAFAQRTTGKSIAEIDAAFAHRRATLFSQPDRLQRKMQQVMTDRDRGAFEDFYGVEDGDFIRVFVRPGNSDKFIPNQWALSPFKFGPVLHEHGLLVPDIMGKRGHEIHPDWKRHVGRRWTDDDYRIYDELMQRNREISMSRRVRLATY